MPTSSPNSPLLVRGGIVTMDPSTSQVLTVIALQYNPESVHRSFQIQSMQGGQDGVRVDVFRLRGPAVETIKVEAELDATDQLEFPKQNPNAADYGLHPQLAQLEMLINPSSMSLREENDRANAGDLEIIPLEQPLTVFVWGSNRVVPMRLVEFSITEEAFDRKLNPIHAKISLGMRVLSVDDLGFAHLGGRMFMNYLKNKEDLAGKATNASIGVLGLKGML